MEIDGDRIVSACVLVDAADGEVDADTALVELVELVRVDPGAALAHAVRICRAVAAEEERWLTDFDALVVALRRIDPSWLAVVIDLVPSEKALWDTVNWALRSTDDERRLIVDRLGVGLLSETWLADSSAPDQYSWASSLLGDIEEWADEDLHRSILLRLIADADDEQIWHVAAAPLEDFINDDPERLLWVEQQAAADPRFRLALTGVWTSGKSDEVAQRVDRARNSVQK